MIGGLLKSASRLALIAAAGVFVGGISMPTAKAADLGGDCCADLEERVAELEATTARKGNRKMSLTITGQVNRSIMYWNDGHMSNTYFGQDNTASSSRFSFLGTARIAPKVTAGFEIMIEIELGGTSSKANQFDEDGKISTANPLGTNVSPNGPTVDSYFGDARRVAWWIEHSELGRVTIGRYEGAGHPYTIDLGGIGAVGGASKATFFGGGFFLRGQGGEFYNIAAASLMDPAGQTNGVLGRSEVLRYDSPVFLENFLGIKGGFIATAFIGEAGDAWGAQLRYAGETCCGLRIAAQVGVDRSRDRATPNEVTPFAASLVGPAPDVETWGAALSLFHVPSGLFIQGHYFRSSYGSPNVTNLYMGGQTTSAANPQQPDGVDWVVQSGVTKNWFGIGNTSLFAEYGQSYDWAALGFTGRDFPGVSACASPPFVGNCASGFSALGDIIESTATIWGVGLVQNIDAAAMELYLGYRRYSFEMTGFDATNTVGAAVAPNTVGAVTATNVGVRHKIDFEDLHVVHAGARVKF